MTVFFFRSFLLDLGHGGYQSTQFRVILDEFGLIIIRFGHADLLLFGFGSDSTVAATGPFSP